MFWLDYFCLSPNEVTFCDVSVNPRIEKDISTQIHIQKGIDMYHTLKYAVLFF